MKDKSIVGDIINFRGLVYAPTKEQGVVFLFGKVADDLNMYVEEFRNGFPNCIGRRFVGKGWERIAIEFELNSHNFVEHGHDVNGCDVIVCWEHDWTDCPIEVIELRSEIQQLENYPIKRPGSSRKRNTELERSLNNVFLIVTASVQVRDWYRVLFEEISKTDDNIWAKVGSKYVGWYFQAKSFASVRINKKSIRVECFSRGKGIPGTKVVNEKYNPRWVGFTIKSDEDLNRAILILLESRCRFKEALALGEPTSYFSGGESIYSDGLEQKGQTIDED